MDGMAQPEQKGVEVAPQQSTCNVKDCRWPGMFRWMLNNRAGQAGCRSGRYRMHLAWMFRSGWNHDCSQQNNFLANFTKPARPRKGHSTYAYHAEQGKQIFDRSAAHHNLS